MLQVLTISVPVFAIVFLGVALRLSGLMDQAAHAFVSRFVYLICLPVLIFMAIAGNNFSTLLQPSVIAGTYLATAAVVVLAWLLSARLPERLRGAVVVSAYLANLTFLGIPLARSAYGDAGETYAGIVNAFTMPAFVVLGVVLLAAGQRRKAPLLRHLRTAVINPVVAAALCGIAASLVIHEGGAGAAVEASAVLRPLAVIAVATLKQIGAMGVPLALVAVGAALRFEFVRGHLWLMAACTAAKLIVMPLATLLVCRALFPAMPPAALGTSVLMMGSPLSVGMYVISREMDAESDFIAGVLVMSTVAAVVTVPAWLAVLMHGG